MFRETGSLVRPLLRESGGDRAKAGETGLDVLDDLVGEVGGLGQGPVLLIASAREGFALNGGGLVGYSGSTVRVNGSPFPG